MGNTILRINFTKIYYILSNSITFLFFFIFFVLIFNFILGMLKHFKNPIFAYLQINIIISCAIIY